MSLIGNSSEAGRSIFMSSMKGLANTFAVVATFVGAPPLYSKTVGWVYSFASRHYGNGVEDFAALAWAVICGALVFFISRASISTGLVMLALAIATRFL